MMTKLLDVYVKGKHVYVRVKEEAADNGAI